MDIKQPIDVVTGGAGFIGSHLAERLLARGRHVRIVDNLSTGTLDNVPTGAEFVLADVVEKAESVVQGADVVYHLAAIPSVPYSVEHPRESHRANVESTVAVLEAARQAGVRRVVFASSSAVYGDAPVQPRRETDDPKPPSPYAVGKLCSELYAKHFASLGLETVSLRFFNVYGPRQDPRSPYAAVIPIFIEKLLAGGTVEIFGSGRQVRDFIYVGDVAEALTAAGSVPWLASSCFNIASGRPTSILDLAHAIATAAGVRCRVKHLDPRPGDIARSWADMFRAATELGFRATTSLEEGLAHTLKWFEGAAVARMAEGGSPWSS